MNDGDELYALIKEQIERRLKSDRQIQAIQKKIDKGTATHAETEAYAKRLGEITSKVLLEDLTEDDLPDGELYYGIAKKAVGQTMRDNLTRVNAVGKDIQTSLNASAGIGLAALGAKLNADRINGLVSNMDNCHQLADARELMREPVINTTQSYADDLIKENADFQYNTGMNPKIIRTASAGCCEWCAALEGEWDYPGVDPAVFQRHEHCDCVITYHPNRANTTHRTYRDAASLESRQAQIEARRSYGL